MIPVFFSSARMILSECHEFLAIALSVLAFVRECFGALCHAWEHLPLILRGVHIIRLILM